MSELQIAIPALVGMTIAIAGWWYSRRIGVQQAEVRLMHALRERISLLESAQATSERMTASQITDLERRLKLCEERWRKWSSQVGE